MMGETYDVFVSHRSTHKEWVETLCENLKSYEFRVFFDQWELQAGKSLATQLSQGLEHSENGVLVVTEEAYESGWVRQEYEEMLAIRVQKPDFRIIPLILDPDVPGIPFLQTVLWVDFRPPKSYQDAFYRLVCALKGQAPGNRIELPHPIKIPNSISAPDRSAPNEDERQFVDHVFDLFSSEKAVLLLAQEGRLRYRMKSSLLEKAVERFISKSVIHLVPPYTESSSLEGFFKILSQQCHMESPGVNAAEFQYALSRRLESGSFLFLLVSGFEHSHQNGQEALAGLFRALNATYPDNFRILICGGEKLSDLYFTGALSFLNHASAPELPELSARDALHMQQAQSGASRISPEAAQALLDLTGGHPLSLKLAVGCRKPDGAVDLDACKEAIENSIQIWQLFTSLLQQKTFKEMLPRMLREKSLGPSKPHLSNPLLKRLYWKNLIRINPRDKTLIWRSELLREIGEQVVQETLQALEK